MSGTVKLRSYEWRRPDGTLLKQLYGDNAGVPYPIRFRDLMPPYDLFIDGELRGHVRPYGAGVSVERIGPSDLLMGLPLEQDDEWLL